MKNNLLKEQTTRERDIIKGKILAQKDFDSCVAHFETQDEKIQFFKNETSEDVLTERLIEENDERKETVLIARIKEFNRLKNKFLKKYKP